MRHRTYPRTGWQVSEIGYGMWGMGGWTGSDDEQSLEALDVAIGLGCNFFDTAWAVRARPQRGTARAGAAASSWDTALRRHQGATEGLRLARKGRDAHCGRLPARITSASTPRRASRTWAFETLDVQQLHVWSDAWAEDEGWKRAVDDLKRERLITSFGISVNRWEPANVLEALESGLVDCVQVVYNIFDQDPEDVLFPYCQQHGIADHRARAVRRRQPDRDAAPRHDMARGRLAQPVFHPAATARDARPRESADAARAIGPDACPSWLCGSSSIILLLRPRSPGCGDPTTSGPTWPPVMASPCRRSCSSG